jgi:hypothetical protein
MCQDFFGGNSLNLTALDFFDVAIYFRGPSGFRVRGGGMSSFCQALDQLFDFVQRPISGFFDDLLDGKRHKSILNPTGADFNRQIRLAFLLAVLRLRPT